MLKAGLLGEKTVRVDKLNTAAALGSGTLEFFATHALVALMEGTAMESVAPHLEPGQGTVGAGICVRHTAPSPVGMTVRCRSRLVAVEGRRLRFEIEACDDGGPIGTAEHERYIIDNARFLQKAAARGEGKGDV